MKKKNISGSYLKLNKNHFEDLAMLIMNALLLKNNFNFKNLTLTQVNSEKLNSQIKNFMEAILFGFLSSYFYEFSETIYMKFSLCGVYKDLIQGIKYELENEVESRRIFDCKTIELNEEVLFQKLLDQISDEGIKKVILESLLLSQNTINQILEKNFAEIKEKFIKRILNFLS